MSYSKAKSQQVGDLVVNGKLSCIGDTSKVPIKTAPAAVALGTSAAVLTAAQMLSGICTHTPGSSLAVTTPTAAAIVAAVPAAIVGSSFDLTIVNLGANTSTLTAGDGGVTIVGTAAIATTTTGSFRARITNITASSEAVVFYRL